MLTKLSTVSQKQLDEALAAAQAACIAYTQPEEVRPGLKLCASGRVVRAMHMAGQQPKADWPKLHVAIDQLEAAANAKLKTWVDAERQYRDLCEDAGVEPSLVQPGEACDCEGCQLTQQGIEAVRNAPDRRPILPKQHWRSFDSFAEAQTVYKSFAHEFKAALGFDRERGKYVLCAAPERTN